MVVRTYFVYPVGGRSVKIGKSVHPEKRMRQLQGANPTKLALALVLPDDQERQLHKRFARYRCGVEWFFLEEEIRQFVIDNGGSFDQATPRENIAGLDLIPQMALGRGRPRLPDGSKRDATIQIRVKPDQMAGFKRAAESAGKSLSEWARGALLSSGDASVMVRRQHERERTVG